MSPPRTILCLTLHNSLSVLIPSFSVTPFTKTLSLLLPVRCSVMISPTGREQREWKNFFLPNGMGLLCTPVNLD